MVFQKNVSIFVVNYSSNFESIRISALFHFALFHLFLFSLVHDHTGCRRARNHGERIVGGNLGVHQLLGRKILGAEQGTTQQRGGDLQVVLNFPLDHLLHPGEKGRERARKNGGNNF